MTSICHFDKGSQCCRTSDRNLAMSWGKYHDVCVTPDSRISICSTKLLLPQGTLEDLSDSFHFFIHGIRVSQKDIMSHRQSLGVFSPRLEPEDACDRVEVRYVSRIAVKYLSGDRRSSRDVCVPQDEALPRNTRRSPHGLRGGPSSQGYRVGSVSSHHRPLSDGGQ